MARAIALHQQGQLQQAAMLYLEVLAVEPDNFDALHLLGVFALQSGDAQAACDMIAKALAVRPDAAAAHGNRGAALQKLGRLDEALLAYQQALLLTPDDLDTRVNRACTLLELRRFEEARSGFEAVLAITPDHAEALNHLGRTLFEVARHEEALLCLERALELRPGHVAALFNRANALQFLNRIAAAQDGYAQLLAIAPGHVDANLNAGVCRLLGGDLEQGWKAYEWRWHKPGFRDLAAQWAAPLWLGAESLQGKRILIYAEQGLGDTLQFCRYARLLTERGATVLMLVQAPLKRLLAGLPGTAQVLSEGDAVPAVDYRCPMMSLPLALGTTAASIPAWPAYLASAPGLRAQWAQRLGAHERARVGVVWAGNASHASDAQRSIPLREFAALLAAPVDFVALQKEIRVLDALVLRQHRQVLQAGALLGDFADTAGLVDNLDLVICVDTSVAHLAAAMGKPVWLLLPFAPDWRWMLEREDSPWYPSVRLFRQQVAGDWGAVLLALRGELEAWAADGSWRGSPPY